MANTITQTTLLGAGSDKHIVRLIKVVSDGSEETDLVIYDNSTLVNNTAVGAVERVMLSGSGSCLVSLEWDQTTDSPILSADPSNPLDFDFTKFGGIKNPNGAGATGDIVMSTANLDLGDEFTLIIVVRQS